jgi:hypothetical protein
LDEGGELMLKCGFIQRCLPKLQKNVMYMYTFDSVVTAINIEE